MNILETPRTYVREYVAGDAGFLVGILSDVRAMNYAPMAPTNDVSIAATFIEWHRQNYITRGFSAWAVILKDGDAFIGQSGLLKHDHGVELFFSFLPDYWRRGLATEVALACRDHAFNQLGIDRLISIIHPENQAAMAVAAKVGMKRVGWYRSLLF